MKTSIILAISFVLLAVQATAAEYLIVIPARGLPPETTKAILTELVTAASSRLPAKMRIQVVDPVSLDLVASLNVPEGTKARRERNVEFARQVAALRVALLGLTPHLPWEHGALRLPETLRFLSEQIVPRGEKAVVIFIGSPLYRSGAGTFDFIKGTVPGDGWLSAPPEDSPFSAAGLAIRGWTIHLATLRPDWAESEWQSREVQRFWCAFVDAGGGRMVSLAPLTVVWDRLAGMSAGALPFRPVDSNDDALVWRKRVFVRGHETESLLKFNDASATIEPPVAVIEPLVSPASTEPAPPSPLPVKPATCATPEPASIEVAAPASPAVAAHEPEPPAPPPVPTPVHFDSSKTGIGIAWSAPVDLDLYLRLNPGTQELYYRHGRSPEGFLYKDERSANAGRQYEFIEFRGDGPIDLSRASVWVNYYSGHTAAVTGQVALFAQGRVRIGSFTLAANRGNAGRSGDRRATSPHWVEIKLADLIETTAPLAASRPVNQ